MPMFEKQDGGWDWRAPDFEEWAAKVGLGSKAYPSGCRSPSPIADLGYREVPGESVPIAQREVARLAVAEAAAELDFKAPGIKWFVDGTENKAEGWFLSQSPASVWVKRGLSDERTREVARHEVAHAFDWKFGIELTEERAEEFESRPGSLRQMIHPRDASHFDGGGGMVLHPRRQRVLIGGASW